MKKIIIGGLGLNLGILLFLGLKKRKNSEEFSKTQIILILTEVYNKLKNIRKLLAKKANEIKETQKIYDPFIIKTQIANDSIFFNSIFSEIKDIYLSHGTTEENLTTEIYKNFPEDDEINSLQKKINKSIENSYKGIAIENADFLSINLTRNLMLKILKDSYDCELFLSYMQLISESHFLAPCNSQSKWESKTDSLNVKILNSHGIAIDKSHVRNFFRLAIINFKEMLPDFSISLSNLQKEYNANLSNIHSRSMPDNELSKLQEKYLMYSAANKN